MCITIQSHASWTREKWFTHIRNGILYCCYIIQIKSIYFIQCGLTVPTFKYDTVKQLQFFVFKML